MLFESLAGFSDKARVLNRDDGLIGEGANKLNLPLGKGFHAGSREDHHALRFALAQQRHPKLRANLGSRHHFGTNFGIGSGIRKMYNLSFEKDSSNDGPATRCKY